MKILELYKNSSKELEQNGILTSKLDVKILLSYLLNIDSKELIMYFLKLVIIGQIGGLILATML